MTQIGDLCLVGGGGFVVTVAVAVAVAVAVGTFSVLWEKLSAQLSHTAAGWLPSLAAAGRRANWPHKL